MSDYDESSDSDKWGEEEPSPYMDGDQEVQTADSYTILAMNEIGTKIDHEVSRFTDLYELSYDEALILMYSYQWNVDRMENQWLENELEVRAKTGLSLPQDEAVIARARGLKLGRVQLVFTEKGACPICYETMADKDALQCGHSCCVNCWKEFFLVMVREGQQCLTLKCPFYGCPLAIPETMIKKYLERGAYEIYFKHKCENYVHFNKKYKWCPFPNCKFIAEFPTMGMHEIRCTCEYIYCFVCGEEGHRPTLCEHIQKWNQKNSAESENVTWIIANTKQCPACHRSIEKNQGCNHMTCRREAQGCGHEFCWMCMGPWSEHNSSSGGYYKCNKYEEEMAKDSSSFKNEERKREEAKNELDRYIFYFERYNNHNRAQTLAKKQLIEIESKMRLLHDVKQYPIGEVQFLKESVLQIIECRRVLKNTYAFGFFLETGREKYLFENLQQWLEEFTELLHELTESKLDPYLDPEVMDKSPFYNFKSELTNKTQTTAKFLKDLIEGVEYGLISDCSS